MLKLSATGVLVSIQFMQIRFDICLTLQRGISKNALIEFNIALGYDAKEIKISKNVALDESNET